MGNCPGWALSASVWVRGWTRVDSFSQWTFEGFSQPWSSKSNSILELSRPFKQYPRKVFLTSGFLRWHWVNIPPSSDTEVIWQLGVDPSSFSSALQIQEKREEEENWKRCPTHLPSYLDTPYPSQWSSWSYILVSFVNNIEKVLNNNNNKQKIFHGIVLLV